MRDLPTGTVTFLFTDIEGSTRLLRELGDRYADALDEHRRVLREAFAHHGGAEVDTQGDAFFVAFDDPAAALAAAGDAQRDLELPVRMGIHTGEPELTDEGYVGIDVHLGARIAAAGHGGQVLLSKQTRDLVDGVPVRDLGEHRLKDFGEPVWVFQLGDEAFPPLRTIANTNLPRPASSFVGREQDVANVVSLLGEARLVTLTGPGGSGKTRLAIEAASEVMGAFPNGVFWVGLAAVRDASLVQPTIAQTIGARGGLEEALRDKELLLLLDNLEQVVDAAPDLAALVEACATLRLLVTSRERLRVAGEIEYEVLPLGEPDAVELFCTRAQLSVTDAVAALCRRLDHMPLALELAAARTKALSPEQILERLGRRLDLLKGGRGAEPRQQTLRATIEWSYDLLDPSERELFADLAVFAGGCTLDAAEAVCDADVDSLQALVEKSLVRRTADRFSMLETIREYAVERLDASGDRERLERRHAEFFVELASARDYGDVPRADSALVAEQANLRAALDRSLAHDAVLGLRLVNGLESFWPVVNPIEGMRWYEALLERAPDAPLELRARALRAYGGSANPAGRDDVAERAYAQSYEAFRELGDREGEVSLLLRLGYAALYRGDTRDARSFAERGLELLAGLGDRPEQSQFVSLLGEVEYAEGNHAAGLELMERSAELAAESGFTWWRAGVLGKLADHAIARGDLDAATAHVREALALSLDLGDRLRTVRGLARLAVIASERGDFESAGALWGAVEAEERRGPLGAWENERDRFEGPLLANATTEFERARADGRSRLLGEAVDEALASA